MVVLVERGDGRWLAVQPTLRDRVAARLLAARWDERLAQGEPPERDVRLALRAERLVRSDTRRWLARSLRRLLDEAHGPARPGLMPTLSLECRRRLLDARESVTQIIEELQRPAPLSGQGMAALCVLLRDGSGPLYGRSTAAELRDHLARVKSDLLPLTVC